MTSSWLYRMHHVDTHYLRIQVRDISTLVSGDKGSHIVTRGTNSKEISHRKLSKVEAMANDKIKQTKYNKNLFICMLRLPKINRQIRLVFDYIKFCIISEVLPFGAKSCQKIDIWVGMALKWNPFMENMWFLLQLRPISEILWDRIIKVCCHGDRFTFIYSDSGINGVESNRFDPLHFTFDWHIYAHTVYIVNGRCCS